MSDDRRSPNEPTHSLQLAGGICELVGFGTVALGISDTRRAFTDRPSFVGRIARPVKRLTGWLVARIRKRKGQSVEIGIASEVSVAGHLRAMLKIGSWAGLSVDEKLDRARDALNRHEEMLSALDGQLAHEADERRAGDEREKRHREALSESVEQRIREAAAGGLRIETIGACFLAIGLVLGTWGNLIS